MKKEKDLKDVNIRLRDFFRNSTSKEYTKNPYNILFMVENSNHNVFIKDPISKQHYIDWLKKACIKNEKIKTSNNILNEIVADENLIIKSMEYLVENGADISKLTIAITRFRSLAILKKAVELGAEINLYENGNYPMRNALKRTSFGIVNYLWNLPEIKKYYYDNNGDDILKNALDAKNLDLVCKIWDEERGLFTYNNKINILNFMNFYNNNQSKIIKKYEIKMKNIALDLLIKIANKEILLQEEQWQEINSLTEIKKLLSIYYYGKLTNELSEVETKQTKKLKI